MRKILHITDVHFGRLHQPDRAEGLVRLAEERQPDVVAFSGDVTKRAKPSEFRQGLEFVAALGVPTVVVPGNHDVPMYRVWERVFSPLGAYRRHFSLDLEPTFRDDELLVVGVNTAHAWTADGGRVWPRRARRLESQLREQKGNRFAIVMLHHQIIPVPGYPSPKVFWNASGTARALAAGGADLVLSGHVHLSHLGYSRVGETATPVLFSGTACSSRGRGVEEGRNTCHWIEVDDQQVRLERLEWTGVIPFEIERITIEPDGFRVAFTKPVDSATGANPASYAISTFTHIYHGGYGGPEVDQTTPAVTSVALDADGMAATIVLDAMLPGHVHEFDLAQLRSRDAEELLHHDAYYTVNAVPAK